MPVRVGGEDGTQYVTTQVEAIRLDDFLFTYPRSKITFQKRKGCVSFFAEINIFSVANS